MSDSNQVFVLPIIVEKKFSFRNFNNLNYVQIKKKKKTKCHKCNESYTLPPVTKIR